MTYQLTYDVSLKGWTNFIVILTFYVLEGMVQLQEAAVWSIGLIFIAAPALTGKTVGFSVPDSLKVL